MTYDDIVVGAGHNGLTAAAYLARAGRRVLVLEKLGHVGGAAISARVFEGVDARLSRYAYLVSLLPRQLIEELDLDVRLARRRYSSYTPDPKDPGWGLLVDNADAAATAHAFRALTLGDEEYAGWRDFHARIGRLAERLWPTMLEPLRSADDIRAVVDDEQLWVALTQVPLGSLVWEYFRNDVVRGVVATDGLIGTFASVHSEDLVQNVCFLYHVIGGGTGEWDVPVGGMGAVTAALAGAATRAGADLRIGCDVLSVDPSGEVTWREDGSVRSAAAGSVVVACAPAVLDRLLEAAGAAALAAAEPPEGSQLKVNLLLHRLPRLKDPAVDPATAFAGTFHVNESLTQLEAAYADALAGRIPAVAPCEVYCHTLTDRSILGPDLAGSDAQTLTVFGLHMPARLFRRGQRGTSGRGPGGDAAFPRRGARRARRAIARARPSWPAVHRRAHAGRPRGAPRAAGRQHLPPGAALAVGAAPRRGGHLGGRDSVCRVDPGRCRGPARRRGVRHTRPQRGDGSARAVSTRQRGTSCTPGRAWSSPVLRSR